MLALFRAGPTLCIVVTGGVGASAVVSDRQADLVDAVVRSPKCRILLRARRCIHEAGVVLTASWVSTRRSTNGPGWPLIPALVEVETAIALAVVVAKTLGVLPGIPALMVV